MKAIVIYEAGGPEKLIYTDVPTPEVKDGWSLVKVKGFGINHSEIFTRDGLSPTVSFPRILGIECVGIVEETTDPERLPEGAKVISIMGEMGRDFDGGYAEYALLPNEQIHRVETDLPWEILAAMPETYYTAFGSFKALAIEEGDSVLVRGGTSGVGIAFLRLVKAKFPDVEVFGTTRSASKSDMMERAGFDGVVIDRGDVLETDRSFDKVMDLIGPSAHRDTVKHTNEGGTICVTGLLGGKWTVDDFDPLNDVPVGGYLTGFHSGYVTGAKLQEMIDFVTGYGVDVTPEKVFTLEGVPDAHRYLESGASFGKVVALL